MPRITKLLAAAVGTAAALMLGASMASGEETIRVTFCLYPHNPDPASEGTAGSNCTVDLHVNRIGHEYELETGDAANHESPCINLGGIVEVEAHFITTPSTPRHRGFEVHHLDDV